MKVIYLASPYRAADEWTLRDNVDKAHRKAREIWLAGFACISPVSNTAHFGSHEVEDALWILGDIEILKRCDALFLNDGWQKSRGCRRERIEAEEKGMPIFEDMESLRQWEEQNG